MDAFEEHYWNQTQLLAWVYLGDRQLVQKAAEGTYDWRSYERERTAPDGRKVWEETFVRSVSQLHMDIAAAYKGGAAYPTFEAAEEAVIGNLQQGRLHAVGLENGEGNAQEVPQIQWAELRFAWKPPHAASKDFSRSGASCWYDLRFVRSEVLEIWPVSPSKIAATASRTPSDQLPNKLDTEHRSRGGRKAKYDQGLQEFINRLYVEFVESSNRLTLSALVVWLTENAPKDDGYESTVPSCDDIEFYDDKVWWKDRQGHQKSAAVKTLERYIRRARNRTSSQAA